MRRVAQGVRRRVPRFPEPVRPRGASVVLLYHRVAPLAGPDPTGMVVTPEHLAAHVEAVRAEYELVPLAEVGGGGRRAAITFDDGYADNAERAAPLLRAAQAPATFFLTTAPLEGGAPAEYWWDELEHLVLGADAGPLALAVPGGRLDVRLDTDAHRRAALKTLSRALVRHAPPTVEDVLRRLRGAAPSLRPCDAHRRMTPDQARDLAADGLFTVGSHTCTHSSLRALGAAESLAELSTSRRRLADLLGEPPDALAYPYGAVGTLRRRHLAQAAAAGYRTAYTNVPGPVEAGSALAVPRVTVGDWPAEQLLAALRRWRR